MNTSFLNIDFIFNIAKSRRKVKKELVMAEDKGLRA
jgi:hypothetical protein